MRGCPGQAESLLPDTRTGKGRLRADVGRHTELFSVFWMQMGFPPGNQTQSFLMRDLSGHGRGIGEQVGAAALNNGFLMDLEKLLSLWWAPKPDHLLGAGCSEGESQGAESSGRGGGPAVAPLTPRCPLPAAHCPGFHRELKLTDYRLLRVKPGWVRTWN